MAIEDTLAASESALSVADADVVAAIATLRTKLIARGAAVKTRSYYAQMAGRTGEAPSIQSAILSASEAFVASVGGWANAERLELNLPMPAGWTR